MIDWNTTDLNQRLRYDVWEVSDALKLLAWGDISDEAKLKDCKEKHSLLVTQWQNSSYAVREPLSLPAYLQPEYIQQPAWFIRWALSKDFRPAWLEWAINEGLYISSGEIASPVEQSDTPAPKVGAVPDTKPNDAEWCACARDIADECFNHDTTMKCRDSLRGYSSRVMEIMQERGITGPRGIIDNAGTIMREALQGKKWWANKSK